MDTYIHSTIAMLAVINPVVCGTIAMQLEQGKSETSNIISGVNAMVVHRRPHGPYESVWHPPASPLYRTQQPS